MGCTGRCNMGRFLPRTAATDAQNLNPQQSEGNLRPEPAQDDGAHKILPGGAFLSQRR